MLEQRPGEAGKSTFFPWRKSTLANGAQGAEALWQHFDQWTGGIVMRLWLLEQRRRRKMGAEVREAGQEDGSGRF